MGDYPQMVALADATIALAIRVGDTAEAAKAWINRAYACTYLGRFSEADAALDQGTALATQAGESITAARAQWNRARLLRCQGQLFAALSVLRAAQRGLAQAAGEAATIALEEAAIYDQLRQLPEAQRAARFAAQQFAQQAMPVYSAAAALQAARIAIQQRQASAARTLLQLARDQSEQARLPVLNAEITLTEAALVTLPTAAISTKTGSRTRRAARAAAQQAVAILLAHGAAQEADAGDLTIAALSQQLGETDRALAIYRRQAEHGDRQVQLAANSELGALLPPAEALPHLRRAVELAVELRRSLPMEELQARYSGETSPYHMRLATCLLAIGAVAPAVEAVCAAKAGPLLDLRAAAGALDTETRALLEHAKADIARWRELAHDHTRKARDAALQQQQERATYHTQEAQTATAQAQASEQNLTATLRILGDRSGQARVPTLADIQLALSPKMALLEYAKADDDLICFLIQPERSPQFYRLGDYRRLAPLLDRWSIICRRLIDDPSPLDAEQQIHMVLAPLWDLLLTPMAHILATTDHLLIAPYDILHHIPWAALYDGVACLSDYVTLTLTPCGAMWAARPEWAEPSPGPPRLLGYAGSGKHHLAHVNKELAGIARQLTDSQVYPEATAKNLQVSPPPRVLHIAAHGLTNPAAPLCSTIELADGPFLLLEAHRLNLRGTRLVTLSACETSVRPDHGDMALALAGAFLCAGAHAVLASLWRVSDAVTATLMEWFYTALVAGAAPATALRQAQRQVRRAHPLDWAAFQLWAGTCEQR
jgi:CHAT domain-containing protein